MAGCCVARSSISATRAKTTTAGNGSVGLPVFHGVDGETHGGGLRAADRLARFFACGDRLGRVDDRATGLELAVLAELLQDQFFVTEDLESKRAVATARTGDPGDDCRRPRITTHCVDRDPRACVHRFQPRASRPAQASVEVISRPL